MKPAHRKAIATALREADGLPLIDRLAALDALALVVEDVRREVMLDAVAQHGKRRVAAGLGVTRAAVQGRHRRALAR